jgi:predicted PurR-regulated permease PerM
MTHPLTRLRDTLSSILPRWIVILLAIPLGVLNGWVILQVLRYFGSTFTVLVVATLLAFLLNFPVQLLEKRGIGRGYSILLVFLTFLGILATLGITLLPLLFLQLQELITHLPDGVNAVSRQLEMFQAWAAERRLPINVSGIAQQLEAIVPQEIDDVTNQVIGVVLETADSLFDAILTIALTLYLLLHGEGFWQTIFQWFPEQWTQAGQQLLSQNFRNYFVGQMTVAVIEGTVLTIVFFILRVPFFLLFGIGIGLMVLIPFFDVLGALLASLIVGVTNPMLGATVLVSAILIDQIIDNTISPRILGRLVGLNPVWVILSLLIGIQTAGFLGIILAVPLASTIGDILSEVRSTRSNQADPSGQIQQTAKTGSEIAKASAG